MRLLRLMQRWIHQHCIAALSLAGCLVLTPSALQRRPRPTSSLSAPTSTDQLLRQARGQLDRLRGGDPHLRGCQES